MEKREQDVPFFWMEDSNEQLSVPLKLKKKVRPKKMEFIGWGSKPLIEFLRYIGKDTCKQLSQYEVTAIINEYVNRKNLLHPGKKKRVVCDDWLHSIFGRKSVPRIKFYDLLESHLAENHDESEDDLLYSSDGEENMACKKQKMSSSDKKTPRQKKQVPETPKSCFAAIISENIKLLYLKRSLVQDLLKDPESFEGKVVGSYVRIKSDPNDYFQKNSHQLLQVTGVRKAYGSGDVGTENFLQVPNLLKDIRICMLSDDNFSEEECEDLRQRVKAGLLERPTVVEFEQKAQILHEDITKHWLVRELALLQNLIDRANEKGWRKDFTLFEYLERKQLLETPSERSRLLLEVPKVIADELEPEATLQDPAENVEQGTSSPKSILREASNITIDVEANQTLSTQNSGSLDASGVEEAAIPSEVTFCNSSVDGEGNRYFINGNTSIKEPDGIQAAFETCKQDKKMGPKDAVIPSQVTFCNISVDGKGNRDFINGIMSTKQPYGIQTAFEMCKQDKNMEEPSEFVQQQKKFSAVIRNASSGEMQPENSRENMGLKGMTDMQTTASQVIELSDDDEEVENPGGQVQIVDHSNSSIWHHYMNPQGNIQGPLRNLGGQFQIVENPDSSIWHYMDPQGNIQGPFSMTALKRWSDAYYFQPGFKIWKRGQSQDKAVLLSDMLRLMFPI